MSGDDQVWRTPEVTYPQMSFADLATAPARARGPRQSQLTLDSLGRDESMKRNVARAVVMCSRRGDPKSGAFVHDRPVTDDQITEWIERRLGRRQQRNVIARSRGLMERDGWFDPVPDVVGRTGRPTHAVVPSAWLIGMVL